MKGVENADAIEMKWYDSAILFFAGTAVLWIAIGGALWLTSGG